MSKWLETFERIKPYLKDGHHFEVKSELLDLYYAGTQEGIASLSDRLQEDLKPKESHTHDKAH